MNKRHQAFLAFILVLVLTIGLTQQLEGHGAKKGFIGPEQLKDQLGKLKLLDIRSEQAYKQEHIDTALVVPLKEISEARLTQLDFQKKDDIVVYANSDHAAQKAKVLLEVMGFTSLKVLSGGLVHWKEDGFPTVSGEMERAGEEKENTPPASSLMIQPAEYDFGIISKQGGVVSTKLFISNNGDENVTIEEISTSCGCTSAEVSENVVRPGKTVSLIVRFDPNYHKEPEGRFSRTIFLQTSEEFELQAKIYVEIKE